MQTSSQGFAVNLGVPQGWVINVCLPVHDDHRLVYEECYRAATHWHQASTLTWTPEG